MERCNRIIVKQICHSVQDNMTMWDALLPILTYAYITQPHRSTGFALFEIVLLVQRAPLEWVIAVLDNRHIGKGHPTLLSLAYDGEHTVKACNFLWCLHTR